MHAIRLDDLRLDAQPRFSLPAWDLANQEPTGPVIRVRRSVRRHRNDLSWIPMALFALAGLTTVCVFAKSLVEPIDPPRRPGATRVDAKKAPSPRADVATTTTAVVEPTVSIGRPTKSRPAASVQVPTAPENPPATAGDDESQWMAEALQACRESRFVEAKSLGRKVGGFKGQAICLLADYLQQYETLSLEAILRMNGAVEVDLGPNHGLGAFVERVDGTIVFMCRGRHVRLTVDELLDLTAVRFRITRQFLANGSMPANDLVLAAAHVVHGIDEEGNPVTDGARARAAARSRLMIASSAPNDTIAMHAKVLLSLIDG